MTTKAKVITWATLILVLGLAGFIYFRYCFVYDEGVDEGRVEYVKKTGVIFKTYEGEMVMPGVKSRSVQSNGGMSIESPKFKFSITDEQVARRMMEIPHDKVKVHWHGYFGTLPWRGNSRCIVDSIVSYQEDKTPMMIE